ncbi:transposase [Halomicroarcula sp. GCM10025817]|uniref:transposase n=1 Tax=Haloarcula TaxID=2237 RepID=UPI0023E75695|nr:transposase [Halomicroarcula sp. SYNS111]
MTDRTVEGGHGTHSDAYVDDLYGGPNGDTEVDFTYQHNPRKESYGPVEERGRDIDIEHPVDDVEELSHRAHLTVKFADRMRQEATGGPLFLWNGRSSASPTAFDSALLAVADRALTEEGVSVSELPKPEKYVKALLVHDAWKMNSYPALRTHLVEATATARLLGFETVPDQSSFWRASAALEEDGYRDPIRAAATRAVHAVFRWTTVTPQDVVEAHALDHLPHIDERAVAGGTRRTAIQNWIDHVLDKLLAPISFDRASNMQYTVREIVAAVAQATLVNGLKSSRPTAAWYYDTEDIPSAAQVSSLLGGVTPAETLWMFTDVNQRFIDLASDLGFFARDYDYALDTSWVKWDGKHEGREGELKLIENPKQGESGIGWLFAGLCVSERDARFAFGIDLVEKKSETTEQLRYLLRKAEQVGGVGRVHIDREFYDGDAVRMCRTVAGLNWVIRAKRKGEAATLLDSTPVGESAFKRGVGFSDVTPNPNLYVHPIPEAVRTDGGNTHMAFLTDLSPDLTDLDSIYERYQNRWNVETFFRQLKHDHSPVTRTPYPSLRLFLLNLGTLFYNIHTLINRARSPEYGLRLDVPFYEVLIAIVNTTYTRAGATDR